MSCHSFPFACPWVGDETFHKLVSNLNNLHILRVKKAWDIIPNYPFTNYSEVRQELVIDTGQSSYLRKGTLIIWHNLETYLHGVAGTQGRRGGFKLEIKRDITLVNKFISGLKDEYHAPASWWCEKNKGMMQQLDGSWVLMDHEHYEF